MPAFPSLAGILTEPSPLHISWGNAQNYRGLFPFFLYIRPPEKYNRINSLQNQPRSLEAIPGRQVSQTGVIWENDRLRR